MMFKFMFRAIYIWVLRSLFTMRYENAAKLKAEVEFGWFVLGNKLISLKQTYTKLSLSNKNVDIKFSAHDASLE